MKIEIHREKIENFCRKYHVCKLSLFGSVLGEDFGPDSDIDVLVEFETGHVPGFFKIFDMEEELSSLFGGQKVDIRTPEDISRYFRREVLEMAQVQYAE